MKILLSLLTTGLLVLSLTGCDGNILTNKSNSTIDDDFDNDGDSSTNPSIGCSFDSPLPNIISSNSSAYPVSGTCDPNAGGVTVVIGSPDVTVVFPCDSNGNFSGVIDVSTVALNPPNINATQGSETAKASPVPENDQNGPASAPTATAPATYVGGGASYDLPISCNEAGEVVSITGNGIDPDPQTYTCTGSGSENFPLALVSPVETANPNSLTVSSTDEYGNPSGATTDVNVPVDTQGPTIAISNSGDVIQGQTGSFVVTVTDSNFLSPNYIVNTSGAENVSYTCTTNPCNITTGIISSIGALTLTVAANAVSDDIGNTGDSVLRSSSLTVNAAGALGFNNPLPTINIANSTAYLVSGLCDDALGNVMVTVTVPTATQSLPCDAPGQFSGTINVSGVTSNPPSISVTQGVNTVNASPNPTNDQNGPGSAPTATGPGTVIGVSSYNLPISCNEAGEVVSITGNGIDPDPQTYTCSGSGSENFPLSIEQGVSFTSLNNLTVSSTDQHGNPAGGTTTVDVPVDTLAPTVVITNGGDIFEGVGASFTITVTDDNITNLSYTPTVSSGGTLDPSTCTANPCNVIVSGASLGALTLTVAANAVSDDLSNTGPSSNETSTLTVNDDPLPVISSISIGSTDGDGDSWYENSDTVIISVQFSELVTVNTAGGTPSIPVTLTSGVKTATYATGTGTNTLNFNFAVSNGDEQCNGSLSLGVLALNSGTIQDSIGQDSDNTLGSSIISGVQIDAVNPTLTGPLGILADDATTTIKAVTTSWVSQFDNCAIAHVNMAVGTHNGFSCNAQTAVTSFLNIGTVTSYQPVSGVVPFNSSDTFTLSEATDYCTSVSAVDSAGNMAVLSSDSWQAANTLVLKDGVYEYSDGSYAATCNAYLNSSSYDNEGDGVYRIDPDGAGVNPAFAAQCDMASSSSSCGGGGWTLVLNYLHKGGTAPNLNPLSTKTPAIGSSTLGTDESSSLTTWGHVDNTMMSRFTYTDVRYYCKTSLHNRLLNFYVTDPDTVGYFKAGTGSVDSSVYTTAAATTCTGHTANLPGDVNGANSDAGDSAMTAETFRRVVDPDPNSDSGYWNLGLVITGGNHRWECDDYANGPTADTHHQIWIK